jgi:hypothetical protein
MNLNARHRATGVLLPPCVARSVTLGQPHVRALGKRAAYSLQPPQTVLTEQAFDAHHHICILIAGIRCPVGTMAVAPGRA